MQLRPFAEHDDVAYGIHGPDRDGADWRRTVVAEEDGHVIGRGLRWCWRHTAIST